MTEEFNKEEALKKFKERYPDSKLFRVTLGQQRIIESHERRIDRLKQKELERIEIQKILAQKKGEQRMYIESRNGLFLQMKLSGMTLGAIGKEFGVTREYIRQELKKIPGYDPKQHRCPCRKRKPRVKRECPVCHNLFEVEPETPNKKYCSMDCYRKARPPRTPEYRKEYAKRKMKEWYAFMKSQHPQELKDLSRLRNNGIKCSYKDLL